jgi:hypothetical protein
MITTMAMDRYNHDPLSNRTSATTAISHACQRVGIKLTDETIKKQLRLAIEDCEDDADAIKKFLRNRNSKKETEIGHKAEKVPHNPLQFKQTRSGL